VCGIIGYVGDRQAAPLLLEGLDKLQYRGYDSAGIAVRDDQKQISVVKTSGKLEVLVAKTDSGRTIRGRCGIGHTRWATHGEPSGVNSHPHVSCDGKVVVVHNGIIENYAEQKEKLKQRGFTFVSATDTEVAANMLAYYYRKNGNDPQKAIAATMLRIKGSFAFGIMFEDYPDIVFAARNDSPLVVGDANDGYLIASDTHAILAYTKKIYYLNNMELAMITRDGVSFLNIDLEPVSKVPSEIAWDSNSSDKGEYDHYMIKEIEEQPKVVQQTLERYIQNGKIDLGISQLNDSHIKGINRIYILGCGSAYHAAQIAKYQIENLTSMSVETEIASEFRYRNIRLEPSSMVIVISQSGETADTLAALRRAKESGVFSLAIVNVQGSAIAREADGVLYTCAGPEISVATTKAYSAQLAVIYLIAIQLAYVKNMISEQKYKSYIGELSELPERIRECIKCSEKIKDLAVAISGSHHAFYIGRGVDCAVAMEGSLKLKEISYIHSEAYAAGELKHGTISLIENGSVVIGIITQRRLAEKTLSNIQEVKSRGAYVIGISNNCLEQMSEVADVMVSIPSTDDFFAPSLAIIPLQLLAYYVCVAKGMDVDKPRNLAKSVTVE